MNGLFSGNFSDKNTPKEKPFEKDATARVSFSYFPDNAIIRQVRVYSYRGGCRYYEDFEKTMYKYIKLSVKQSAERVSFFSYMPQYSQLSREKLSFYLYWRTLCRKGEYIQADFSYILLYVFELLNFSRAKYPEKIVRQLCLLWRAYRREYPQLDRYLSDWVCDYCLIHKVDLPRDIVCGFYDVCVELSSFREFYFAEIDGSDAYVRALALGGCLYSYKKSKFYTDKTRELYDEHIPRAVERALLNTERASVDVTRGEVTTLRRDAFVGALVTYGAKKTIEVDYYPLTRSGSLGQEIAKATKYAENRLRSYLGIKSRLFARDADDAMKREIDAYFDTVLGESLAHERDEYEGADYMAYYEAESSELDFLRAADIEKDSWHTAEMMGGSFDVGEDYSSTYDKSTENKDATASDLESTSETKAASASECVTPFFDIEQTYGDGAEPCDLFDDKDSSMDELFLKMSESEREVIRLLFLRDYAGAERYAIDTGAFLSGICDSINEKALDVMYDILIDRDKGCFYILSDYEGEVRKCLKL